MDPFLGEIRILPFNFAPQGWALCNGQLLAINTNAPLFSLLGTTYGGNGVNTFGLPDLRSRVPIHWGNGPGLTPVTLGQKAGVEAVTLNSTNLPLHNHRLQVDTTSAADSNSASPSGASLGKGTATAKPGGDSPLDIYSASAPGATLAPQSIGNVGGASHTNIQPVLAINFCIATQGIFPSRS